MPNMTGRPGYRTMEMIGGSSAPYLACTPCVPLFSILSNKGGSRGAFSEPGAGGPSFPLYGGTFARSYSVSISGGDEWPEAQLLDHPELLGLRLGREWLHPAASHGQSRGG